MLQKSGGSKAFTQFDCFGDTFMKNKYIIDGYNLGHKMSPVAQWLARGDTERAIRLIMNYIVTKLSPGAGRIIVVFDGKHGIQQAGTQYPGITVKFSKKPQSADDIIRQFIRKEKKIGQWTVVSSDNEVLFSARDHGAQTMKSEILISQTESESTSRSEKENIQKYDPKDIDVDYWLKTFGGEDSE